MAHLCGPARGSAWTLKRGWRGVVPALDGLRCIVPNLPLGAHRTAMSPSADLSPPAIADLVVEFLDALGLPEATIVANDTGGAIAQMLAARHPERVSRLLLTPCDTYDNFLPPTFRYLQAVARIPGGLAVLAQSLRIRPLRRLPFAFGRLTKRPLEHDLLDAWLEPMRRDPGVRCDLAKVLRGIRRRDLLDAAERLKGFERPVLLAFAPEDPFFKLDHAERMARELPNARVERIEDSGALAPLDQPARVAELVRELVAT
ncbi:MAG: alpha/beta fold hydrolase [Solirubrobacteraceae bacterium]